MALAAGGAPAWAGGSQRWSLRYCARPPFALERLELIDEQRVIYRLPRIQRDGTRALSLTPLELIDQLAALIPPPKRHRHRYQGVPAPNSPLRAAAIASRVLGDFRALGVKVAADDFGIGQQVMGLSGQSRWWVDSHSATEKSGRDESPVSVECCEKHTILATGH